LAYIVYYFSQLQGQIVSDGFALNFSSIHFRSDIFLFLYCGASHFLSGAFKFYYFSLLISAEMLSLVINLFHF
jgi:hypothetical protein